MKFKFLYRDQLVHDRLLDGYLAGSVIHESDKVAASTLRGGLLTNTNLRYLFITNIGREFQTVNEDYKKQGLFLFDEDLYYDIYDKYRVGDYVQILLSPDRYFEDDVMKEVIKAAHRDFNELLHTPPVPVLDTSDWRRRITNPLGKYGKTPRHNIR